MKLVCWLLDECVGECKYWEAFAFSEHGGEGKWKTHVEPATDSKSS